MFANNFALLRLRQYLLRGAGFIDHVDGLVGQMPIIDVPGGKFRRRGQCIRRVLDAMVLLKARLQAAQNLDRLLHARLIDVDFLKASRQSVIFLEYAAVFRVSRSADTFHLTGRQRRLEQIRCVQRAAGCGARTDHGVNLINEQN